MAKPILIFIACILNYYLLSGQSYRHKFLAKSIIDVQPGIYGKFTTPNEQRMPNVLLIFCDDLGYGDLRSYNPQSKIATPNVDRLATEGMMFTDAHTSSAVCTPSRYSLLTGRYCWRTDHKRGVQGGYDLPLIKPDQKTIADLFEQKNYATACIGKWHIGMEWTLQDTVSSGVQEEETVDHYKTLKITPVNHGFDYFFGTSGCTSDDSPFAFIENQQVLDSPLVRLMNLNVVGDSDYIKNVWSSKNWMHERADTIFMNKTINFMKNSVERKQPFFVYLPLSLPHIPWLPPAFVQGITGGGPREEQVALIDYIVGELDTALEELGVKNNTIVIFSSDNGPREGENGHQSSGKLRGAKGQIFEGGHRIPLIVRWPGQVPVRSQSDRTVCMTDLFKTFASILDVPLSENEGEDSYNILWLLTQTNAKVPIRSSTVHHSGAGAFAIRKGDWKMIYGKVANGEIPDKPENWTKEGSLYNMKNDPYEKIDLYGKHPEIVSEMNQLLYEYKILPNPE